MESPPTEPVPTDRKPRFGIGMAITGLIIAIAWIFTFNTFPPRDGTVTAQGVIVELPKSGKGYCEPIAEITVDGVAYRSRPGLGSKPCEHTIGESTPVTYHPDDIGKTLRIPLTDVAQGQVAAISLIGWALLGGSLISLGGNIRQRRKERLARR